MTIGRQIILIKQEEERKINNCNHIYLFPGPLQIAAPAYILCKSYICDNVTVYSQTMHVDLEFQSILFMIISLKECTYWQNSLMTVCMVLNKNVDTFSKHNS